MLQENMQLSNKEEETKKLEKDNRCIRFNFYNAMLVYIIIALKRLVAKSGHQSGQSLTNIEEGGNATGNGRESIGGEGGDNATGSSEAPTEGIILIVFVLLMMCL